MLAQFRASQANSLQNQVNLTLLLFNAIMRSDTSDCLMLIEAGARVNMNSGYENVSMLMTAANNRLNQVCLKMIEKGAVINCTDIDGQSPLTIAAMNGLSDVCLELIKRGAKLNEYSSLLKRTPLWYAIENNMVEVCHKLREAGAEEFPRCRISGEPTEVKAHRNVRIK